MIVAYASICVVLFALVAAGTLHADVSHRDTARLAWRQLLPLLTRLPAAFLAANFLVALVPAHWFVQFLGQSSGVTGVLIASCLGAVLIGGPMVSFPIALVLMQAGVGVPQMVALITAWSLLAVHRMITYEVPMMGWRFLWRRVTAVLVLAPIAGITAELVLGVWH